MAAKGKKESPVPKKSSGKKAAPGTARLKAIKKKRTHASAVTNAAFYRMVHRGQTERVEPSTKAIVDDMLCDHVDNVIYCAASITEARGNNMITMEDVCTALNILGHPVAGRTRTKAKPKKVKEGEEEKKDDKSGGKKEKSKDKPKSKEEKTSKKTK